MQVLEKEIVALFCYWKSDYQNVCRVEVRLHTNNFLKMKIKGGSHWNSVSYFILSDSD